MKKILSTILLLGYLTFCINDSYAQESKFGIKGGAAAYNLTSEVSGFSSTTDHKIGFEAGIFGDFPISKIFSIQAEGVYVQKGGEESDETLGTSSVTLSYVDVPLLLKITAPLEGSVKPYIFGGGYAGYLIEATSDEEGESQDVTEFLEDINYGLKMGLGVHIGSFVIDARYDMGLADLYAESEELSEFGDFKLTTAGVVLSIGVAF